MYEYLHQGSVRKYKVTDFDLDVFTEYSLKFSTLSGETEVNYYTDEAMTKELE